MQPKDFIFQSPIQEIFLSTKNDNSIPISLKRDDLIHPDISGNKWRKLKYNLLKANQQKSDGVLTFGGPYSNHIAATAAAGQKFSLKTIGIIRGEELALKPLNHTLKKAASQGMQLHFVSREEYREKEEMFYLNQLKQKFGNYWIIPEGGANYYGVTGCMEIIDQSTSEFDYICVPMGTGTTVAGLLLSSKSHQKIIGFPALKGGKGLLENVNNLLYQYTFDREIVQELLSRFELIDTYHFGGFAKSTDTLTSFCSDFYKKNTIQLDYLYTSKMLYGINDLIKNQFFPRNSKILSIHTGGIQGNKTVDS